MSEVDPYITGTQCAVMLNHAGDFCDDLEVSMPGTYSLDNFESRVGRGRPMVWLRLATHDQQLVSAASLGKFPPVLEGDYPDGRLWVEYTPAIMPRSGERGSFGPILRALGSMAALSPFPLSRVAGTTCIEPASLTIESLGGTSPEDEAAFASFLEAGGWPHYTRRFPHEVITGSAVDLNGETRAFSVQFDRLGRRAA